MNRCYVCFSVENCRMCFLLHDVHQGNLCGLTCYRQQADVDAGSYMLPHAMKSR